MVSSVKVCYDKKQRKIYLTDYDQKCYKYPDLIDLLDDYYERDWNLKLVRS